MESKKTSLAVFDLDGTITSKDTYLEFIKFYHGTFYFYLGLLLLSPYVILFYLKLYKNDKLKERFFGFFFSKSKAKTIQEKGKQFSLNVVQELSYKSALNILNWHSQRKHDILILTASSDIWLKHWCEKNKYSLICTKFEIKNNHFTGMIDGFNCFGKEKKKILSKYLAENQYNYTYGYGDSTSDKYFLDLTDESYLMKLNSENVDKFWKNHPL